MRTATIHRESLSVKSAIFLLAFGSSDRTTVGLTPEIAVSSLAYSRALSWSVAITRPAASGTSRRTSVSRRSAATNTVWIQSPAGSSAVRQACACMSLVSGSPSRAATSSPALVRHAMSPE
jgi:hypothetical protein